jgi:NADH-quinone oxidoreductase subunit M
MALAVPGTAGFVGEFTVLLSLWDLGPLPALVGGFCLILSATYVLRFIQKVIFGKPAREYQEGARTTALEGVSFGSMLALLLAFGLHPAFVTNSLHLFEETATEETATELVEEVAEPAEEHLMTVEELRELDSTLAASGFSEEERKALLAQIQSIEKVDSAEAQDSTEVQDTAVVQEPAMETDSAVAQVETPAVETEKTEASENE